MNDANLAIPHKPSTGHRARVLFEKWRYAELLSAILSFASIITATIDYELRWSDSRTYNNCAENDLTHMPRVITLALTIAAMIYVVIRHIIKTQWVLYIAPAVPLVRPDQTKIIKPLTRQRSYLTWGLFVDLALLAIFPYPWFDYHVQFKESQTDIPDFEERTLCYTLSELFYVAMMLRVFILIRAIFNYTLYQDNHARHCCAIYGVRANFRFSIKCMIKKYPMLVILGIIVPSFFIWAIVLRVFERPYEHVDRINFSSYWNSLWCVTITMATIGYGDIYPSTNLGRFVCIFCAFWGAFTFSMLVVTLERIMNLSKWQGKAYVTINRSRTAAAVIQASLLYWMALKDYNYDKTWPMVLVRYISLRTKVHQFSQDLNKQEEVFNQREMAVVHLKNSLNHAETGMKSLRYKIEELEKLDYKLIPEGGWKRLACTGVSPVYTDGKFVAVNEVFKVLEDRPLRYEYQTQPAVLRFLSAILGDDFTSR